MDQCVEENVANDVVFIDAVEEPKLSFKSDFSGALLTQLTHQNGSYFINTQSFSLST